MILILRTSLICLAVILALQGETKAQTLMYDAISSQNKVMIFEDQFDGKGTFDYGSGKLKGGKLELRKNTFSFLDVGLTLYDDYEIEISLNTQKAKNSTSTGIIYNSKNMDLVKVYYINVNQIRRGFHAGGRSWSYTPYKKAKDHNGSGFNKMVVRKIDNRFYFYYQGHLIDISKETVYSHHLVGLKGPQKGSALIDYIRVYKIEKFPSSLALISEKYQFADTARVLQQSDVLQPEAYASYELNLKNSGPFDLKKPKIQIKAISGNKGLKVEQFDEKLNGRMGYQLGAKWLFTSNDMLKSGLAKYEIVVTDKSTGFAYDSFPVELKTKGFPAPHLKVRNFQINDAGTSGKIRGGSVSKVFLEVINEGVGDATEIQVELAKNQHFQLLSQKVAKVIPPEGKSVLELEVLASLKFDNSSEVLKFWIGAKGMEIVEYQKTLEVISLKLNEVDESLTDGLKFYYGSQSGFDYQQLKKGLESEILSGDVKAIFWKSILYTLGRGGYEYDRIKGEEMAKKYYQAVYSLAFEGDLEALLLMGMASQYGLGIPMNNSLAREYFTLAGDAGYPYAVYELGLNTYLNYSEKFLDQVKSKFEMALSQGIKKAVYWLGIMNLEGKSFIKNEKEAFRIFKNLADSGDPNSAFMVGSMHLNGTGTEVDTEKAHDYLKYASEAGISDAMLMLGTFYTTGTFGQKKNLTEAHKWISKAANQGNLDALFTYGAYQLSREYLGENFSAAQKYLLQAAQQGHGGAMRLMGHVYQKGLGTDINAVKARFWVNEAQLNGESMDKERPRFENYAMNVVNNMDWNSALFGKTIYGIDQYGRDVQVNTGTDMMGQVVSGLFSNWMSSRMPDPNAINSYEFIMQKNGVKIYAATINGYRPTKIAVKRGEEVKFTSSGRVQVGMFAGITTPLGIRGYTNYNIAVEHPHGCFLARIGSENWQYIGKTGTIEVEKDGLLEIALNDRDNSNNRGGFDIRIEIK